MDRISGHVRNAVRRLGIGNQDDLVLEIHLFLLHRRQFVVDPKSDLRDDAHDVARVARSCLLGPLFFRPRDVNAAESKGLGFVS